MDLQALTYVKLAEHRPVAFDPGKENDYYESVVDVSGFVGATRKSITRTVKWLRIVGTSGQRPSGRLRKLKATTG